MQHGTSRAADTQNPRTEGSLRVPCLINRRAPRGAPPAEAIITQAHLQTSISEAGGLGGLRVTAAGRPWHQQGSSQAVTAFHEKIQQRAAPFRRRFTAAVSQAKKRAKEASPGRTCYQEGGERSRVHLKSPVQHSREVNTEQGSQNRSEAEEEEDLTTKGQSSTMFLQKAEVESFKEALQLLLKLSRDQPNLPHRQLLSAVLR